MESMRERRVLVSGATGGLGPAIVEAFLAVGAEVMAMSPTRTKLDELRASLDQHRRLYVIDGDATDPVAVEKVLDAAERGAGMDEGPRPLWAVVQVTGAFVGKPLIETSDDDVRRLVSLNVTSAVWMVRGALRRMIPNGGGRVVCIGAASARAAHAGTAVYGATKSALHRLVESAAIEAAPHGVTVNAVLPGTMDTGANRDAMSAADRAGWIATRDVAKVVLDLAGDAGAKVNGALVSMPGF